jgi:hypothetical protein
MKITGMILILFLFTSCVPPAGEPAFTGIIVNHNSVGEFTRLSETDCTRVQSLKVYFQHASVGSNICEGLSDLASMSPSRYTLSRFSGTIDELNDWYELTGGFGDFSEGNPGWALKMSDFETHVDIDQIGSHVDVAMMKLCYIDPDASFAVYRDTMNRLEKKYPDTWFVWTTMPIETTGSAARDAYNQAVRDYCRNNNKILFDIADIESHTPEGIHQIDNSGEALFSGYTSDGGHLEVLGRQQMAKALWVLLSYL